MNGVLGMLDMLLDTDMNLTQKDYAQTAQVCGKALIALINEFLDHTKIETGKLEIEAVPFDLRSILDDVLSLFSAKSREKGIELAAFVLDNVPHVLTGDPGRLRRIITNLVGNSIKFTERGHVLVRVHLAAHSNMPIDGILCSGKVGKVDEVESVSSDTHSILSGYRTVDAKNFDLLLSIEVSQPAVSLSGIPCEKDPENVILIVSVEDTGIGIPLNSQDQVFTPFMQADSSTSRNYGGTGIGLSISKCLVELMGGWINFMSMPNVGSTFTFSVVLRRCSRVAKGDPKRSLSVDLPTCFEGTKAVLIDERLVRSAVTKYHLHRLGISVEIAKNSEMALRALSQPNGCLRSGKMIKFLFIEKDSLSNIDVCLRNHFFNQKQNVHINELPKVILLGTSKSDKSKCGSLVDITILKPKS